MKRLDTGVKLFLVVLYAAAVWPRAAEMHASSYPYFKGESGTHYHQALFVADGKGIPARSERLGWPAGYAPARDLPAAVETATGLSYRLVSLISDVSFKEYAGFFSILFFSLCVFTFYGLTRTLWGCRAAGLLAATLVAISHPLAAATRGREFGHGPFALVLVSLHLWLFLLARGASRRTVYWAAAMIVALLGTWEGGLIYAALFGIVVAVFPGLAPDRRRLILWTHAAAVFVAVALWPYLRAPGAGLRTAVSTLEYWLYRFRFALGKPEDGSALPEAVRWLWSHTHAHPVPYTLWAFFVPLLFLTVPAVYALRDRRRNGSPVAPALVLGLLGAVLFMLDRSAVFAAALGLFPLAAASAVAIRKHARTRAPAILVGVIVLATQAVAPLGKADVTYRAAHRLGLSPLLSNGFVWASIGDADRQLVRHLVKRTSVRNGFLTAPELSPLVVAFAGRKAALVPGARTQEALGRTQEALSRFYGDETMLFEYCRAHQVDYVIYSIDMLLDTSRESPAYRAGVSRIGDDAVARKMHFAPEHLEHFTLVYENDNYRLFRVATAREPMFLTDHPPVYQRSILRRHGDTLESFYKRIIDILAAYDTAVEAQRRGRETDAIRRFRYCLEQAPHFTRAWLGVGDSLIRLRDFQAANAAYARVLQDAPENTHALYYAALTLGHLGRVDEALGVLKVFFATGGDKNLSELAAQLKVTLEKGIPLERTPRQTPKP